MILSVPVYEMTNYIRSLIYLALLLLEIMLQLHCLVYLFIL